MDSEEAATFADVDAAGGGGPDQSLGLGTAAPQEAGRHVCLAGCEFEWQEGVLPARTQHNGPYFLDKTIRQ